MNSAVYCRQVLFTKLAHHTALFCSLKTLHSYETKQNHSRNVLHSLNYNLTSMQASGNNTLSTFYTVHCSECVNHVTRCEKWGWVSNVDNPCGVFVNKPIRNVSDKGTHISFNAIHLKFLARGWYPEQRSGDWILRERRRLVPNDQLLDSCSRIRFDWATSFMSAETLAKMANENVETNHHHGDHLRSFAEKNGAAKRAQVVT